MLSAKTVAQNPAGSVSSAFVPVQAAGAAAVAQGRADWGVTLVSVGRAAGLGFIPVQDEQYDFVVPSARAGRPGIEAFRALLADQSTREALLRLGMRP